MLGQVDRRLKHAGAVEAAEAVEGRQPAAQRARHARGADVGVQGLEAGERRRVGCRGRAADVVEDVHGAGASLVNGHEAAAATQPGHERLDHAQRRADGHGRVDGIAALHQDAQSGGGGEPVGGADRAMHADRRRPVGAPVRSAQGIGRTRGARFAQHLHER